MTRIAEEELVNGVFKFHPEILEAIEYKEYPGSLFFHMEDEEPMHDPEETMCLNYIFGAYSYEKEKFCRNITEFYTWLQKIMFNSIRVYAGEDKFNPVPLFVFYRPLYLVGLVEFSPA